MGFVRGFFLVIVSVLLFFSLLSMNFLWILSSSLTFGNVQMQSSIVVNELIKSNAEINNSLSTLTPMIQAYCINNNNSDYIFNEAGLTLSIPCNVSSQGNNAIMNELVKSMVKTIYYSNYDCSFWSCLQANPISIISQQSYNYWNSQFYLFILISVILVGAAFILIEKKTNLPILAGILLIITSLPFIKLDFLFSLFADKSIFQFLSVFFSQAYSISIITIIIGIGLIAIGIVLKVFKIGFSIEEFFLKFQKKEVTKKTETKPKQNIPAKSPIKKAKRKSR